MRALDPALYKDLVRQALDEDLGAGDITTEATVPRSAGGHGVLLAKTNLVLAGLDIAIDVFRQRDPELRHNVHRRDGDVCAPGEAIADIWGSARALLEGERTALNFLQRLSGIATTTRQFVETAHGRLKILDTRKTTPTLRALEKYAVEVGGGSNHRMGLYDAILIKDNHVRLAGGVKAAVAAVRQKYPGMPVEVEAQSLDEVDQALQAGAETILFDNLSLADINRAAKRVNGRARIEVSGGVTLARVRQLALTGIDFVSVGALTHSAPAADISFEITPL